MLPDFLEKLNEYAEEAFGDNGQHMIDSLVSRKKTATSFKHTTFSTWVVTHGNAATEFRDIRIVCQAMDCFFRPCQAEERLPCPKDHRNPVMVSIVKYKRSLHCER